MARGWSGAEPESHQKPEGNVLWLQRAIKLLYRLSFVILRTELALIGRFYSARMIVFNDNVFIQLCFDVFKRHEKQVIVNHMASWLSWLRHLSGISNVAGSNPHFENNFFLIFLQPYAWPRDVRLKTR